MILVGTIVILFRQTKHSKNHKSLLPVTLLKPLKGIDNNLEQNLESCFLQTHPQFEIIFTVLDIKDPSIAIVQKLISKYPNVDAHLYTSADNNCINPKINNVLYGYENAKHPLIWIMDSNVLIHRSAMARSAMMFKNSKVGLVHHLPCGINPQSFGSALEASYLNNTHAKQYMFVNFIGTVSCVNGKSNMYRKKVLDSLGGLKPFGKYIAEDNIIGQNIMKLGFKHAMTTDLAMQTLGKITIIDFFKRRIRWIRVRKTTVPRATIYEPLTDCFLSGIVAGYSCHQLFGYSFSYVFILHILFWFCCDALIMYKLDSNCINTPVLCISAWLFKESLALPLWICAYLGTKVEWRGEHFKLNSDGTVLKSVIDKCNKEILIENSKEEIQNLSLEIKIKNKNKNFMARKRRNTINSPNKDTATENVTLLADESRKKKWENWWIRSLWTFVMIAGFVCVLMAGHIWIILVVIIMQSIVYQEVISIGILPIKDLQVNWFKSLHWYFYAVTNYFLYIESLIYYLKPTPFVEKFLMPFATHHRFLSFVFYMIGFVSFVLSLKKGHYRFQFYHFCWTHMTLLIVIGCSHFIINNIFEGLIWFVLPVSLVICNDITAYIFGFFFGKTPLIRLSPKKTWEGFMGAFVCTFVYAYVLSGFLAQYSYMICPVVDFSTTSFSMNTCSPNLVFLPKQVEISPIILNLIRMIYPYSEIKMFSFFPVQLHALVLGAFASLLAPFGGFFASGFKRAFNIKDFGDSIPGHGGITDRMDCQFLMGVFSYIYFQSFVGDNRVTVRHLLETALFHLTSSEQLELYQRLGEYLAINNSS